MSFIIPGGIYAKEHKMQKDMLFSGLLQFCTGRNRLRQPGKDSDVSG